jgi:hypothetical protein
MTMPDGSLNWYCEALKTTGLVGEDAGNSTTLFAVLSETKTLPDETMAIP